MSPATAATLRCAAPFAEVATTPSAAPSFRGCPQAHEASDAVAPHHKAHNPLSWVKEKAVGAKDALTGKAHDAQEAASDAAEGAKERAEGAREAVADSLGAAGDAVKHKARFLTGEGGPLSLICSPSRVPCLSALCSSLRAESAAIGVLVSSALPVPNLWRRAVSSVLLLQAGQAKEAVVGAGDAVKEKAAQAKGAAKDAGDAAKAKARALLCSQLSFCRRRHLRSAALPSALGTARSSDSPRAEGADLC